MPIPPWRKWTRVLEVRLTRRRLLSGARGSAPTAARVQGTQTNFEARLYAHRFSKELQGVKRQLWAVLIQEFLQRRIDPRSHILDIGGGYCEFINQVRAAAKYVVDQNPEVITHVAPAVTVLDMVDDRIQGLDDASCDVVFASNFFEHLHHTAELLGVLAEIHRVLRPRGRLFVLQPNIKYAYREYWDFLDHHLPLSHASLQEALEMSGFAVRECIPRFLPYTVKSRFPKFPWMFRWYLRLPLLWPVVGKQMFLSAETRASSIVSA